MNTGFDPHCLVQIPALPFSSCARAVQSQMSYLTSLGLLCLGCFIGMLIALTYHVGGLNTSDKCLACGEHSEYVSNCHYGCLSVQWAVLCVKQSGGRRDVIHVWQFINQEGYLEAEQMSDRSLLWEVTSSALPFKLCSEEHRTGGRVLPQSAWDEPLWPEPISSGHHGASAGHHEAAHGRWQAAQGDLRAPGDGAHLCESMSCWSTFLSCRACLPSLFWMRDFVGLH